MNEIMLSKNFSLKELTRNFKTNKLIMSNLENLVKKTLQPLRDEVGKIDVLSGLRSREYNEQIGGVNNSQHTTGQAADIIFDWSELFRLRKMIEEKKIPFDQLIFYTKNQNIRFIHISLKKGGNRQEILENKIIDGEKVYIKRNNINL